MSYRYNAYTIHITSTRIYYSTSASNVHLYCDNTASILRYIHGKHYKYERKVLNRIKAEGKREKNRKKVDIYEANVYSTYTSRDTRYTRVQEAFHDMSLKKVCVFFLLLSFSNL